VGRELGQILRDTSKDGAFIVLGADGDAGSCELLALVHEVGEECLDVSTSWEMHLEECMLQVVLCVHTLCQELFADFLLPLFDSVVSTDTNGSGVGQSLGQEVMSDQVLIVPLLSGFDLSVCWVVLIFGSLGTGHDLVPSK